MAVRDTTDARVDAMRERKFRADLKRRLLASGGLKVVITTDGLHVEYPSGEACALTVHNRTGGGS